MISADDAVFPNNAVLVLRDRLATLDADVPVHMRPLRATDENQCIGLFATTWTPEEDSYEMQGNLAPSFHVPTLTYYMITVMSLVKDMDDERGLNTHSVLSSMVRRMVARDRDTIVALRALSVDQDGTRERVQRLGPRAVRYFSNELADTSWVFLSVLEYMLEVEEN